MNSKQAKSVPLPDFMARMGHLPARVRGVDYWYTSPFRPLERTPSFKVDAHKNVWFDHALGLGGTIIDLVCHLETTTDISRVLASIAGTLGGATSPRAVIDSPATERRRDPPVIESVGAITNHELEAYLSARAIPVDLARLYLKEVAYRVEDGRYRALGFANVAGGYEIRNPHFKGTLGKKDFSYLPQPGSRDAAVFEGVFDFLSVLTHFKRDKALANVLVMNSVALIERAAQKLGEENIRKVHAYLDHDEAGQQALATFQERNAWEVVDGSGIYLGFKDANDFLAKQRKQDERPSV